ncbi:MAG TPA: hypothetical protein VN429_06575, partial [Methanospirillum sp.]|uniref:hypothetical protein n=1 Tax=Methanospirillum sp. TaxID=45200 RepID=UPI002CD89896
YLSPLSVNSTSLKNPSQINRSMEQKVTGKVKYYIVQQGWTVSLPGTITGVLSPDTGEINLNSTDAVISYGGVKYPVTMQIEGTVKNK